MVEQHWTLRAAQSHFSRRVGLNRSARRGQWILFLKTQRCRLRKIFFQINTVCRLKVVFQRAAVNRRTERMNASHGTVEIINDDIMQSRSGSTEKKKKENWQYTNSSVIKTRRASITHTERKRERGRHAHVHYCFFHLEFNFKYRDLFRSIFMQRFLHGISSIAEERHGRVIASRTYHFQVDSLN